MKTRMNKTKYLVKRVLNRVSLHGFANASIYSKIIILLLVSSLLIFGFSPLIGSLDESYRSFAEPSSIPEHITSLSKAIISITVAILGLIVTSTMIALISRSYDDFVVRLRHGHYRYKGSDQVIVIGFSDKIWSLLDAINQRYERYNEIKDVLILLPESISEARVNQIYHHHYSHLSLFVRVGVLSSAHIYEQAQANKASHIVALTDPTEPDSDSSQIKVATTLTSIKHIEDYQPNIVIEISSVKITQNIINAICLRRNYQNLYTCDTQTLAHKMTGMALLDTRHLSLINNFNNYHSNGIYILPASKWLDGPERFRDLVLSFSNCILIGVYVDGNPMVLCSEHYAVRPKDELIIMVRRVSDITYKYNEVYPVLQDEVLSVVKKESDNLNEHRQREMLVCGDDTVIDKLKETLDESSIKGLDSVPTGEFFTMTNQLIEASSKVDYDTILINIGESQALTFRLYMHLVHSDEGQKFSLVDKTIALMDDSDESIEAIRASTDDYHLMNINALIGEHLGQACFDHRLDDIYRELVSIEGADLYLMSADICQDMKTDRELRLTLLKSGVILVGYITQDNSVMLGDNQLKHIHESAKYLVAISHGVS